MLFINGFEVDEVKHKELKLNCILATAFLFEWAEVIVCFYYCFGLHILILKTIQETIKLFVPVQAVPTWHVLVHSSTNSSIDALSKNDC